MERVYARRIRAIGAIASCLLVSACGLPMLAKQVSEPTQQATPLGEQLAPVEVVQQGADQASSLAAKQPITRQVNAYLPRQQYSETGAALPYQPRPNPYLQQQSMVPPGAVKDFQRARSLQDSGKLAAAVDIYRRIAEQHPELAGPWVRLGDIAAEREEAAQAQQCYQKAIGINPDNMEAYIKLAYVYRKAGNFGKAQEAYLAALARWPDFPEAHFNLGVLYDLYANESLEAQKHFEAYQFLTGSKDAKVQKWLVDLRRRTGVEDSFISRPPMVATAAAAIDSTGVPQEANAAEGVQL